jgi:hypothetical protein
MRLLLLFSIGLLLTLPSQAQERIRNVRIRAVDSAQLEIRYDLVNVLPGDSVYFDIRSRLRGALLIAPQFVRGDIGTRLTAGPDRRIVWDAMANGYPLNEEVQAKVYVKTNTLPLAPNTPEPAAVIRQPPVSTLPTETTPVGTPPPEPVAVAPPNPTKPVTVTPNPTDSGRRRKKQATVVLADPSQSKPTQPISGTTPPIQQRSVPPQQPPLVQPADPNRLTGVDSITPPRTRYAGPAWALLSAVAPGIGNIFVQTPKPKVGFRPLLTVACYGLVAYGLTERQKSNDEYDIYKEQKNLAAGEPYYNTANAYYHRYFLATRGAIVLAAADVILTLFKGLRNGQEARQIQGVTLRPGMQAGQPTAVVRYSF